MSSPPRVWAHISPFREASLSILCKLAAPRSLTFRLPFLCFSPWHFYHMTDGHLVFPHYNTSSTRTERLAWLLIYLQWASVWCPVCVCVTTCKTIILSSRTAQKYCGCSLPAPALVVPSRRSPRVSIGFAG